MKKIKNTFLAVAVALTGLFAGTAPSNSAAFFAWQITDVPEWDTLNVRTYPSSKSQILIAYPNGVVLPMTGACTNGLNLDQINGLPAWQQRLHVRYRWCQTWIDPQGNGQYQAAWVYGKYIAPAQ